MRFGFILLTPFVSCVAAGSAIDHDPLIRYERQNKSVAREHRFGGEIRQRYEHVSHPAFGLDPQDEHGVWLQRWAVFGDLQWNDGLRVFAELTSAFEFGRAGEPGPTDENALEFQNLFFEARTASHVVARIGRQELQLGSARLISVRDGPNVRRTFDGIHVQFDVASWGVSMLAVRPREDRSGVFDDATDDARALWGVYATQIRHGRGLDLYYLGTSHEDALFDQGVGDERRHTLGARVFGVRGGWSWNIEPMMQFGRFAAGDIRAWTIASEAAFTWSDVPLRPRLALSLNVASGDRDVLDRDLQTFNPLFPRGNYFSEDALLGPRNFYNVHAFLTIEPSAGWSLTADYNAFFRLSKNDGVYRPGGDLLRSGQTSDARFVASALSLNTSRALGARWNVSAIYTRSEPRAFLRETGAARAVNYFELTARFRF